MELAFRFGKSEAGMSRLFSNWINLLFMEFGSMCKWPHRDILIKHSPAAFLKAFPNVIAVIDGTEIFCQKPSDMRLQSQTYSTYKSHNTLKGLVAVDQRGGIIFASNLMDGSISDKEIVKASGMLDLIKNHVANGKLLTSDSIMGDKGFLIADLLKDAGVNLIIPPFASSTAQMPVCDVYDTKQIAKFRVHVERAMARIKKFKIIAGVVPLNIIGKINSIWYIISCLTNLDVPIVKKNL